MIIGDHFNVGSAFSYAGDMLPSRRLPALMAQLLITFTYLLYIHDRLLAKGSLRHLGAYFRDQIYQVPP